MKEVEKLVNLVVLYTVPPLPQSIPRTEIPSRKTVMGGYFERSMAGFLESVVEGGVSEGISAMADGGDVRMNKIDVEQPSKVVNSERRKKQRKKKKEPLASPVPGESFIGLKNNPSSLLNHFAPDKENKEHYASASRKKEPVEAKVLSGLKIIRINAGCRMKNGSMDDSNISGDWFIRMPDPTKAVKRTIGWYNLFADVSFSRGKPIPPPIISGILQLGSDIRAVSTDTSLISVDIVSDKFRFCKHKVADKIQVNLRDIRNSIPQRQLNRWGLMLSRVFNIYDFCNDNRFVPLRIASSHLAILGIEPSLFMRSRILGFYNQDVDSVCLARDISYYSMVYGRGVLQLSSLAEYLEELIADQSCDMGHVELYCVIKTLKTMENPYTARQKESGTDISRKICVHNERITINELSVESSLSSKIVENLNRMLRAFSGYRRIKAIYMAVSKYQSMKVHISFSVVERLFKIEHISRKDVVAAVCLMERLRMVVPQDTANTYKKVIKNISFLFCNALNMALKREESPNLYGIIKGIVRPNNFKEESGRAPSGNGGISSMAVGSGGIVDRSNPCNGYAAERFIHDITVVYIRRIKNAKNIRELDPIYGSILQFNELFGVVWPIEAELLKAVRMLAVRDAGGWPSGRFGEKIRQILSE